MKEPQKFMKCLALAGAVILPGGPALGGAPPRKTPELVEKGKATFATLCAPCHGTTGDGDGPASSALVPRPRKFKSEPFKFGESPDEVWKTIMNGSPGTAMVGWTALSDEDRWALTYYVLSFRPEKAPAPAEKAAPGRRKGKK